MVSADETRFRSLGAEGPSRARRRLRGARIRRWHAHGGRRGGGGRLHGRANRQIADLSHPGYKPTCPRRRLGRQSRRREEDSGGDRRTHRPRRRRFRPRRHRLRHRRRAAGRAQDAAGHADRRRSFSAPDDLGGGGDAERGVPADAGAVGRADRRSQIADRASRDVRGGSLRSNDGGIERSEMAPCNSAHFRKRARVRTFEAISLRSIPHPAP